MIGGVVVVYRFNNIQSNRNRKYNYIVYLIIKLIIENNNNTNMIMCNIIISIGLLAQIQIMNVGRSWIIIIYGQIKKSNIDNLYIK